jgi:glycosyltransferase involved in cell wall biosynthesis
MRVLHMASGDGWGGAERVLRLLVEGAMHHPELDVEVLLLNEGQLAEELRQLGVKVAVIREDDRSFVRLARDVRRWLRAGRFDVVHAHRYKELALATLGIPRGTALVITVHGLERWAHMSFRDGLRVWSIPILAYLRGVWFVAVSQELERRLRRLFGRKRVVRVPNPMPTVVTAAAVKTELRRQLGWSESRRLVGFVGRLEHVKGPDLFLEIVSLCPTEPGFVVVGSGSLREDLEAEARSRRIDSQVRFLGQVSDAMPHIRALDVLALTSRHEGQPLVLLEAAACGVPIVAFDVGGVREILGDAPSAKLVAFGDLRGFAKAIEEVLGSDGVSNEAVEWGTVLRERHGLPATTASYCAVYRAALGPRRPK